MHRGYWTSLFLVLFFSVNISCGVPDVTTENIDTRITQTTDPTIPNVTYRSIEPIKSPPLTSENVRVKYSQTESKTTSLDKYHFHFKVTTPSDVHAIGKIRKGTTIGSTETLTEEFTNTDLSKEDLDIYNVSCGE